MKILSLFFASCIVVSAEPALIPRPAEMREREGHFSLKSGDFIALPPASASLPIGILEQASGLKLQPAPADARAAVQFLNADALPDRVPAPTGEGYVLRVTPEVINIHASTAAGHFHGLQSLVQLASTAEEKDGARLIPCLDVVDAPRFTHRGFMLDESRHFTGEAGVKRLLDAMARFKLNRLHWHLTDSPAWRIEIKAYPKLTTIGGRGSETDRNPEAPAQFYTQEQIRDIVAYAKARHITIIPEIDMPGHADAAVTAYPEHDGGGYSQNKSKEKWPRFTFNPAKKETLEFLDTILKEVAALFPDAGMIHFGGDEVHFGWHKWPELPEVRDLMKRENLKDLHAVEAWFNTRMAGTINKLGFKTAGWDEIAARDLPTDKTVVFWWRHDKRDVLDKALAKGFPVVLCPRRPCYFDFVQHESHRAGRRWNGFNPLRDTYHFPAGLNLSAADEAKVLGIQACLWTETTITQARRDFMVWPRLVALAEAAWTPAGRKDYASFEPRLKPHLKTLRDLGIQPWDPFELSPEITDHGAKTEYLDNPE